MGYFMEHDRWHQALFCHFKVCADLAQSLLPSGLKVDVAPDGNCYIGLVLLTEKGVGPGQPIRSMTSALSFVPPFAHVDHHGANVRVYVRDANGNNPGIYFFSLECNSRKATLGANVFGIPYVFAKMSRTLDYSLKAQRDLALHSMVSERKSMLPSLLNVAEVVGGDDDVGVLSCQWQVDVTSTNSSNDAQRRPSGGGENDTVWDDLARFFVERYRVYAVSQIGLLSGTVEHHPWPVQQAEVKENKHIIFII